MTHVPTVILSRTAAALAGLGKRVEVPSKLGSVSLIKPLGEGGMSVVHLGRHEILQKSVAVKFLLDIPASDSDPRFTSFIEGARAAAAIKHPGLNLVYHADAIQGVPYLVMELIEGPTLTDLVQKHGPMPLGVACGIMERVCDAVGELHNHAIIHRDIKPANIMIDPGGRVVVTDFGLAMERPAAHFGGSAGGLAGTPVYMAPEMFDATVSTRTDVYALGVTLFELLTGKPPFTGDFQELRFAHRATPFPVQPLAERGVPEPLIVVIERALHKDVLFRPKSARHVLDALVKACDAAGIRRVGDAQIQRYVEVGPGGESASPRTAAPTPAYYERLGTLAEVKRRTPEGTLTAEQSAPDAPSVSPSVAADLLPARDKREQAEPEANDASHPAAGRRTRWSRRFHPGVAIPVLSLLGAVALSLTYHLAAALFDQIVLFYDRMNWLTPDPNAKIVTSGGFVDGRMSWPLRIGAWVLPTLIYMIAPLALVWHPYVRFVLSRPPRDGVTRCGWCRHPLNGIRDLRCPECGKLLTARRQAGEIPIARRWTTHVRYYAFAAVIFLVLFPTWGSFYVWLIGGGGKPEFTPLGLLALVGFLIVPVAASLVALHFFAAPTSWLTGRTHCGKCGADLSHATIPACPACGEHL